MNGAGTRTHVQAWACVHRRSVCYKDKCTWQRQGVKVCVGKGTRDSMHHFLPSSEMFQVEISPCRADRDTVCGCKENQFQRYLSGTHFQCVDCSPCFNGTITIPCEHHSLKSRPLPSPGVSCPPPLSPLFCLWVLNSHVVPASCPCPSLWPSDCRHTLLVLLLSHR